jgi:hypothetical protein
LTIPQSQSAATLKTTGPRGIERVATNQVEVPDEAGAMCRWSAVHPTDQRRFRNVVFSRGMLRDLDENSLRRTYDLMNFGGLAHEDHERALPQDQDAAEAMNPSPVG